MSLHPIRTAALVLTVSALAFPAAAQQAAPDDAMPGPSQTDKIRPVPPDADQTGSIGQDDACQAQPQDNPSNGQTGAADANANKNDGADTSAGSGETAALSDKLDRCGGVLKPPPTGQTGMVEPAPDVGRTPVIPPEQLPEQQPAQPKGST
jgi:hypothetical protein